jgi:isopenicillin-N N-acyltransferase-like protein
LRRASGLKWDEILEQAPRWTPIVEDFLPGIGDEMRGIAEGAGIRFEEVLALNARGELSHGNPFADAEENTEDAPRTRSCRKRLPTNTRTPARTGIGSHRPMRP